MPTLQLSFGDVQGFRKEVDGGNLMIRINGNGQKHYIMSFTSKTQRSCRSYISSVLGSWPELYY